MKKFSNIIMGILALAGLVVTFGLSSQTTVNAADNTGNVNVTLHKQKFSQDQTAIPNSGIEDGRFTGTPLNGITFNVYDVTDSYYAKITGSSESRTDAIADLEKLDTKNLTSQATAITEGQGAAKFSLPAKSNGKDAVYLFVESEEPGADPTPVGKSTMVLVLPAYKPELDGNQKPVMDGNNIKYTDDVNTDIHLYPKNKVIDRKITINKVGTDNATALIDGAEFTLQNSTGQFYTGNKNGQENGDWSKAGVTADKDMSTNVAQFGDKANNKNVIVTNGSIDFYGLLDGSYTLKEVKAPNNYTQTTDSQTIQFTIANGKLDKSYVIEDSSTLGNPEGFTDNKHDSAANTIIVENRALGSLKFDKVDANTKEKLSGATFKVAKDNSTSPDYLYQKENPATGEYAYAWKSELTDPTSWKEVDLTSTDGSYSLSNLKLGNYYVQETTAPEGYALPQGDSAFTKIAVSTAGIVATVNDGISNVHKGALPSTGGKGIYLFIAVGIIALIIAGIYFTRGRKQFEA